ncbi:MAG: DNA polymerase delta, subunit 4-domain-containing protein [Linnemannia elongata]|nr:MAG: DNA polymerase delta, subunit 4-domain-containing protein [Linnemannia elongata]
MAPPKRSPTDSSTTTAANNFFTRGKKPTTTQRIVAAKKAAISSPSPAVVKKVVHHHSDEDEEDEVSDEIEHADTDEDEDVQLHTSSPPPLPAQQVDEDEEDRVVNEYDSLNEEIEQSDDDSDAVMATTTGRTTRSSGGKAGTGAKKKTELDPITRPAVAKVSKPTLPTRSSAGGKDKAPYVAPNVGDIHSGFHQADLSDSEKMLRQFDLASKYGPCTDMTRLERWERAFTLGLHPPQHVKDTLLQHSSLNTPLFEGRV